MKILCLEDETFICQAIIEKCQGSGRIFVQATTNKQAAQLTREHADIDLLISDFQLKDESSEDFFDYLREENFEIPAIIFSSLVENEIRHRIKYHDLITIVERPDYEGLLACVDVFEREGL